VKSFVEIYSKEYEIEIKETHWGTNPRNNTGEFSEFVIENIKHPYEIYVHIGLPNEMQKVGTEKNILVTSGIETTLCPYEWLIGANKADLIIVPSEFTKKVFELSKYENKEQNFELKLTSEIIVIHEGIDEKVFMKQNFSKFLLPEIKEKFCFLMFGQITQNDRKNVAKAVYYFLETFKDCKEPPALIIKTNVGGFSKIDYYKCLENLEKMRKSVKGKNVPNVYLIHGELTESEIVNLYNNSKIKGMINVSRGEGFGRPTLEFLMCKKPVILSNFSGHLDYIYPNSTLLVDGVLRKLEDSELINDMFVKNSQWFEFNVEDYKLKLNYFYKSYVKVLYDSEKCYNFVKKNFNKNSMKQKIKEILK